MPPSSQQTTDGNNRVTLATISAQIEALTNRVDEFVIAHSALDSRLRDVETTTAINQTNIAATQEDVTNLEKLSERWSIANSIVAAAAAIMGVLGLNRQ